MNPIKKLKMEDALVPESQKDTAYYCELERKYSDIATMYNRRTIVLNKSTAALLMLAIAIWAWRLFVSGES